MNSRRILIFFSDTGGGHRAAATALRDAFQQSYPGRYEIVLVDGFTECAPFPFNHTPALYYPLTAYASWLWGFLFWLSNNRWTLPLCAWIDDFFMRSGCARVIRRVDPALVISVHPLINRPPRNALREVKPDVPFVTVVTDLFDAHGFWFAAASDLVVVPTQGAFERGVAWNFPRERMRVVGQPIALKFAAPASADSLAEQRARLKLKPDLFTVLLVGGGEGMGPLRAIAHALDSAGLPLQLAIIAGRNESLQKQLEQDTWNVPVNVQGFVSNMPDWMRASDLVITKAGPGTIMEAMAAGKPVLVSGNLPGQEEGNVRFVEQAGVGVLRTAPEAIAAQVREWMGPSSTALEEMRKHARRAARPAAALEIVETIEQYRGGARSIEATRQSGDAAMLGREL